jgi:hypothetical protein
MVRNLMEESLLLTKLDQWNLELQEEMEEDSEEETEEAELGNKVFILRINKNPV